MDNMIKAATMTDALARQEGLVVSKIDYFDAIGVLEVHFESGAVINIKSESPRNVGIDIMVIEPKGN